MRRITAVITAKEILIVITQSIKARVMIMIVEVKQHCSSGVSDHLWDPARREAPGKKPSQ